MAIGRIAYAYSDPEWVKLLHSLVALKRNTVEPLAYLSHMKGFLFVLPAMSILHAYQQILKRK